MEQNINTRSVLMSRFQRCLKFVARGVAVALSGLLVVALIGHLSRGPNLALSLCMYLPLIPLGLVAIVFDALQRGRALPRFRFVLTGLGTIAVLISAWSLTGDSVTPPRATDESFTLLHWNVHWGGGSDRSAETWAAQQEEIAAHRPDIVVLSEAPPIEWCDKLAERLGPDVTYGYATHEPAGSQWFAMAVFAQGTVTTGEQLAIPDGMAIRFMVELPEQSLEVLVADGVSDPFRDREPFLRSVAEGAQQSDLILGDFNTPSRAAGFDLFLDRGYALAGRSGGWRGTFPSKVPLYDIDHVWVGSKWQVAGCEFFTGPHSDHRGQLVTFLLK